MKTSTPTICRVCGSNRFAVWGKRLKQTLYQCKDCELVFFFPYSEEANLTSMYNNNYHTARNYDGLGTAGRLRKQMYELDIRDLNHELPQGGRILDFGCAEGVFLSLLDGRWEKYGIDVSEFAVRKAREKGDIIAEVKTVSDFPDRFFDVVHFRGVFEHLCDPLGTVREVNRKLKDTGALVLSNTPNIGAIVPRLFRGRFRLVLPNEHVHYFSPRTMRVLSREGGFHIRKIMYPYFKTPYCSFLKNLLEIPFNFLTGRLSPPFWGNIFTLYLEKTSDV